MVEPASNGRLMLWLRLGVVKAATARWARTSLASTRDVAIYSLPHRRSTRRRVNEGDEQMVWPYGVLILLAFLAPALPAVHPVTAQMSHAGNVSTGRDIYLRYCAGCHGEDGRGEAKTFRPNVGNLAVKQLMDELSDEYLFTVIKKGGAAVGKNAAMPAWSKQLGDDDIRDVVAFIRTLSRR